MKPRPDSATMAREEAESMAVAALTFVAQDPVLLPRFLAITGIEASQIRQASRSPGFLAGVLGFVLAHEPTLIAFAEAEKIDPARVGAARRALPHGDDRHLAST